MSEALDLELAETARKLFAGPIEFLKSAPELQFLPDPDVPEIAFAGRSNVGKSSLLNALTNRKGLARTSNTPGSDDRWARQTVGPARPRKASAIAVRSVRLFNNPPRFRSAEPGTRAIAHHGTS